MSELKCPFCGAELTGRIDAYGGVSDVWLECPNDDGCEHVYTPMRFDVWQALIDGKAAQDALTVIADWDADCPGSAKNRPYQVRAIQNYAMNILKQLQPKEENNDR